MMEDVAVMRGDKLILRGLKFHGYHGVKPEERKLGQKFLVDVDSMHAGIFQTLGRQAFFFFLFIFSFYIYFYL